MNGRLYNEFIFAPRYHVLRHIVFWCVNVSIWATFWHFMLDYPWWRNLLQQLVWLPVCMLYTYPLMYWVLPKILLKGKYPEFLSIVLLWGIAGIFINYLFRFYIFIPFQEYMQFPQIVRSAWQPGSYLCLTITAASGTVIKLFKHWLLTHQEWIQAEKEKVTAELQLLKAQLHPHFLFNTLNNIYSFSLDQSPQTPGLILKLSSLLSYMLYDCKSDQVRLEKEIEIMKNYVDLERERYGNQIEISWSVEGNTRGQVIAPLLILPFLENAFKHGASKQIEKPWLTVDISVKSDTLRCKIANSKNETASAGSEGIGIGNVQRRLDFLYPGAHELRLNDEGSFFVVSLQVKLDGSPVTVIPAAAYATPAPVMVT